MVPGWQVYVNDGGVRTVIAEAAHPPVRVSDGGRARKPVWAHDSERASPLLPTGGCRHLPVFMGLC
jgi:hypothetical protein